MPTPSAPPSTPSAVRSMPAADSANISPTNSSTARIALAAILRTPMLSLAPCNSLASSNALTHSANISTSTPLTVPSMMLRTEICVAPIFHLMSSSSFRISGSSPVIHSTTAIQASHETLRSNTRTSFEFGKLSRSTRTVSRITASEMRMGTASLNTAIGTTLFSTQRASSASSNANAGNNAPSMVLSPNQVEPGVGSGPRITRTRAHASARQPAITASSMSAVGLIRSPTRRPSSSAVSARVNIKTDRPAREYARPRCGPKR